MAAFTTQCPSCRARIKLQDKKLIGKKAKCPKCQKAFVITPAAGGAKPKASTKPAGRSKATKKKKRAVPEPVEDDFGFLDDLTPDEFEASEEELDEFDELDEEPQPPSRRRDRSAGRPGKKSKQSSQKKSSTTDNSDRNLVIGFVVMGVFALLSVGFGIWFLSDKLSFAMPTVSRMAWLPDDTATFVELDPETIWNSRALRSMRESRVGVAMHDEMLARIKPLEQSQIKRMAIGVPSRDSLEAQPVFVINGTAPFNIEELRKAAPDFTEASHAGVNYFRTDIGLRAAYFPKPDVLVYATEDQMKSLIDKGGECAAEGSFDLPSQSTFVFVTRDAAPSRNDIDFPMPDPPDLPGLPDLDDFQQMSGSIDADYDFTCGFTLTCKSEAAAASAAKKMNTDLTKRIDEMEFERSERLNTDQIFKLDVGGIRRLFTSTQGMLKSMSVAASGADLRLEFVASNFFLEFFFMQLEGVDPELLGLGVDPPEEAPEGAPEENASPFAE